MKNIIFLIIPLIFFSCSINKKDVLGKYEYKGDKIVDSIIIQKDFYKHKIFDKQGKLLYEGQSTWEINKDRIVFSDFYDNEDYDLRDFLSEEQAKLFLMRVSCPIYKHDQQIIIEMNADENIFFIKK